MERSSRERQKMTSSIYDYFPQQSRTTCYVDLWYPLNDRNTNKEARRQVKQTLEDVTEQLTGYMKIISHGKFYPDRRSKYLAFMMTELNANRIELLGCVLVCRRVRIICICRMTEKIIKLTKL
jgi:hypothetical protein